VYEIDKENLLELREGIAANTTEFQGLVSAPSFSSFYGSIHGEKNKMLPAHLKSAAAQEPLIFNKQFYFYATFPAELILKDELLDTLVKAYEIGKPIESFFNQFIHRS
jgi:hypothetical protein